MKNLLRTWAAAALPIGLATLLTACQLATPMKGPGIDRSGRFATGKVGPQVYVGITNAVLGAADRSEFDRHTRRVVKSLPTQPGYVAHSVRTRIFGNEVWTMTIWDSDAALTAFVRSPVHQEAMREGISAVTTAKFDRFEWSTDAPPPTWKFVLERLTFVKETRYASPASPRKSEVSADGK